MVAFTFQCFIGFAFAAIFSLTLSSAIDDSDPGNVYIGKVINEFPHDPEAFTEGLVYAGNGTLYESTGLNGKSSVRKVDLLTGKVKMITKLDAKYFGEGLALLGKKLFQLTYEAQTGFIYSRKRLNESGTFTHEMQDGWGLATDGKVFFGSDGTSFLYQLDPTSFKVVKKSNVTYKGREVRLLNELEYVNGEVWANVWLTDCIARISPDGELLGWVLLPMLRQALAASGNNGIDVLNGIAWDRKANRLFVTGKLWPKLYEIEITAVRGWNSTIIQKVCMPLINLG